jgi:hypothetical protein
MQSGCGSKSSNKKQKGVWRADQERITARGCAKEAAKEVRELKD